MYEHAREMQDSQKMSLCSLFVLEQIFFCLSSILKPKFILLLTVKDECSLCQVCVCVLTKKLGLLTLCFPPVCCPQQCAVMWSVRNWLWKGSLSCVLFVCVCHRKRWPLGCATEGPADTANGCIRPSRRLHWRTENEQSNPESIFIFKYCNLF